jgi:hypothetical protein
MVAEWMKVKKYDISPKKSVKVEPEKENVNLLVKCRTILTSASSAANKT